MILNASSKVQTVQWTWALYLDLVFLWWFVGQSKNSLFCHEFKKIVEHLILFDLRLTLGKQMGGIRVEILIGVDSSSIGNNNFHEVP